MGLVVPIWIWLPVILWVMWKYERGKRQRLEMRWVNSLSEDEQRLIGGGYGRPILVEEKRKRTPREMRAGVMEMRSMMIVAAFGLLSAFLYAREPGPVVEQVAQGSAMATMGEAPPSPAWTAPGKPLWAPGGQPPVVPGVRAPFMTPPQAAWTPPPPGVIPGQPPGVAAAPPQMGMVPSGQPTLNAVPQIPQMPPMGSPNRR